uniref:Ig-like domain-containing protein n=1 Tax=Cyprinodon variegatus TaxID=28743 RepID=A0A3Q2EJX1_CYPVA
MFPASNQDVGFHLDNSEAGLCAVIPCSFKSEFEPKAIIWFKCEKPQYRCTHSDPVFHSDKSNTDVQPGFKGRVSLLEPDVTNRNCSIIINDLSKSDSGYYLLKVEGDRSGDKYYYTVLYTNLSVKDLHQKPEVKISPLIEGQQVTLSCTAPGFCSGSPPKITWMWRRKGEEDSYIQGNITASKTENLTAVTKSHSSTLTFKPSVENHNTIITCQVSFTGNETRKRTATLNVNCKNPQIFGETSVKEGDDLNLTCSVDSFPPSWKLGNGSFSITNESAEGSGLYICTVEHLMEEINVTLTCE